MNIYIGNNDNKVDISFDPKIFMKYEFRISKKRLSNKTDLKNLYISNIRRLK